MKKTKRFKIPRALANRLTRISAYSIVLVAMTFLGLYTGLWLDKITGMAPNSPSSCSSWASCWASKASSERS